MLNSTSCLSLVPFPKKNERGAAIAAPLSFFFGIFGEVILTVNHE
ncbi:MAG: hypothetical protein AAFR31_12625 [Cyanobacteria bacterium J06627_8]